MELYQTLAMILVVHMMAVAIPGPDFFCVTKASIFHGPKAGCIVALGITAGLLVHIAAGMFGVAALMANPTVMWVMKILCGAYLVYLGYKGISSKAATGDVVVAVQAQTQTLWSGFQTGFLCNLLNPKVPLYFLSLFTVIIPPSTSVSSLFVIALMMIFSTVMWFSAVALVFSNPFVQEQFKRLGHWLDRVVGVLFLGFGVKVLFSGSSISP